MEKSKSAMYFAAKYKLGIAISDAGYSNYELLNRINDKYYCNLNKDTFRKTLSLDERDSNTLNLNCVIFICKYLNLDLNDIFETGTIGKSYRISNNITFPIKDGQYSFIMRSTMFSSESKVGTITIDSSKNDDSIVVLTIDDSHYKTADIRPSKSGYFSVILSDEYDSELNLFFANGTDNGYVESCYSSPVTTYTLYQGILLYKGTQAQKFLITNEEVTEDNRYIYSAFIKCDHDRAHIMKSELNKLRKKYDDVNYYVNELEKYDLLHLSPSHEYYISSELIAIAYRWSTALYIDIPYERENCNPAKLYSGFLRILECSHTPQTVKAELTYQQNEFFDDYTSGYSNSKSLSRGYGGVHRCHPSFHDED